MSVPRTTCPSCGAGLKSASGFNPGQAVRCPKCATPFTVPAFEVEEDDDAPPPPKKKGPPARAARPRDDDDDRPRRRRPRDEDDEDDDDDDRPRKKKKTKYQEYKGSPVRFAILGVLLVVLGVLAFLLYQKKQRENEDTGEGPLPGGNNPILAGPIPPRVRPAPADGGGPKGTGPDADAVDRGQKCLKAVMGAMHSHADQKNAFPTAAITSPPGRPLLSWRVAILPLLGHDDLYRQFKLNEPWDSAANRPLLAQMPEVFRGTLPTNDGKTAIKVFVGNGAVFDTRQARGLAQIPDGTSNTLAVVESGPPVEWTKPDDIPFDGRTPPRLEAPTGGDTILAALADGRVIRLNVATLPPDTLWKLIHASDGEVVDVP